MQSDKSYYGEQAGIKLHLHFFLKTSGDRSGGEQGGPGQVKWGNRDRARLGHTEREQQLLLCSSTSALLSFASSPFLDKNPKAEFQPKSLTPACTAIQCREE